MGRVTSNIDWTPNTPAESFTNANIHPCLFAYTEMAREVHGPTYNPTTEEHFDAQIVMRVRQGKKHGRFWLGDGTIDTSSTPTLTQIWQATTSSDQPICQRPPMVLALQVSAPLPFLVL